MPMKAFASRMAIDLRSVFMLLNYIAAIIKQ